jgi:hypothetical protein
MKTKKAKKKKTKTVSFVLRPDGTRSVIEGKPDLQTLQALVGGYIERVGRLSHYEVFCNEDGKPKGLPVNYSATLLCYSLGWPVGDHLVGDIVFIVK